jgi:hypothetical protein
MQHYAQGGAPWVRETGEVETQGFDNPEGRQSKQTTTTQTVRCTDDHALSAPVHVRRQQLVASASDSMANDTKSEEVRTGEVQEHGEADVEDLLALWPVIHVPLREHDLMQQLAYLPPARPAFSRDAGTVLWVLVC